jgi:glycerophosphoryl diester phosphodiesterase
MYIITHRGLDPSQKSYFKESSFEAFCDHLSRGFGLEFDLQFTKDNKIVISHEDTLKKISSGEDERRFEDLTLEEIVTMSFEDSHITSFEKLLEIIGEKQSPNTLSAIHLKHKNQTIEKLEIILSYLKEVDTSKYKLFDVTIEAAKYLKEKHSSIQLAPSVSHPFDIERYNDAVGGTLTTLEKAIENNKIFSWVWLDEWDLIDANNKIKKLYTEEVFEIIRSHGMKIALVTPELHATSPGLLGGESHQDAETREKLFARIQEILELKPDAVCTDYPDAIKNFIQ